MSIGYPRLRPGSYHRSDGAKAFKTTAPPAPMVADVAVTASEASVWNVGAPHPVIEITRAHRSPEHTCDIGEFARITSSNWGNSNHRGLGMKATSRRDRAFASVGDTLCRRRSLLSYGATIRTSGGAAITPIGYYRSYILLILNGFLAR